MSQQSSGLLRFFSETSRCSSRRVRRQVSSAALAADVELLESRRLLTVTFHGGDVIANVEAQAVYHGGDWQTNPTLSRQAGDLDQFLSTLVRGQYMDMLTNAGYGVGRGTSSAGVIDNLTLNKSTGITDASIQHDLQSMITARQVQAPSTNRLYVVYVEPGVVVRLGSDTSATSFLGYHGAFAGRTATGTAADIHYAVMPYPGGVNPTPGSQGFGSAFDELTAVSSHEVAEAVTDPNVNYKNLGWYDDNLNGEIGDLTNDTVVFSNYVVQKMVDKNDRPIGPVVVTTTLTAPQNVTLRATSSTSATLAWNPVSAAQGYRIFQVNGSQSVLLGTVNSQTTSVQINGLAPGSNVSFKVEAYSGTAIADSQAVSVTMPTGRLIAPVVTARILTASSVQLNWNAVAGTEGYRIYWSDGVHRNLLGTFGPGVTSIRISGLSVGATYKFQIEAYRGADVADSSWISVNPSRNQVFHALVSNDSVSGIVGTPTTNRRSRRSLND